MIVLNLPVKAHFSVIFSEHLLMPDIGLSVQDIKTRAKVHIHTHTCYPSALNVLSSKYIQDLILVCMIKRGNIQGNSCY